MNIQWDKLEHIKEEIYKKFDEEKIRFKKYTEYLLNSFNLQKKEFNLIKSRFTDMSNVFKHFSTARNGFENLDRKEIIKVARRLNFDKKQKMSKEDTEMINKEEKENNILKIDGEENTNNEHQLKKKKKSDSGDFKKEDSNYSFNINNQEDENNLKLTDENFIDLDINNINKNNRKININQNNSNSDEFKNIYTKIAIKSFNKKSKEANEDINKNEDNLKDKNENEELINIKSKDGNNNTFTKILNKEMLSKLKKQKTLKKIKINDNDKGEKEEKEEKEELALTKDNFGKKFILSENDKINEFLSLSNEAKSFINNCTNTTPHNLKLKKIVKKIEFKKNEAISPLQFDNSFFKLNSDKENIFYYKIIQYLNTTSRRINNSFENISLKLEHNLNSIKKEINQIYNDVNMMTLNSNQKIRKAPPFYFKINNYDLNNNSSFQLNMENFKKIYKHNNLKNRPIDRNFSPETPRNILNNIEPYLIKKFKEKK